MGSWRIRFVIVVALLTLVAGVGERFDPFPQGLRAEYFPNANWISPPAMSRVDWRPSTLSVLQAWRASLPRVFSTVWSGSIVAPRQGTYSFATLSDDGSLVFIDGQLVVDNGGNHSSRLATGSIDLTAGSHELAIRYFQGGGDLEFEFKWARGNGRLDTVPAWALRSRRKATSLVRLLPSIALDITLEALEWIWAGMFAVVAFAVMRTFLARLRRFLERQGTWPALRWILIGSLALNLPGIWWGLPGMWVPIEVTPSAVLAGLTEHFSHGWFDAYPPVHYYMLTVAMTPILLLQQSNWLTIYGGSGYAAAVLACRLVSLLASLGVVVATAICGARVFGRRAGLFAAAMVALTVPFLYYSKTANVDVPYLFWWALSLVFYVRMLDDSSVLTYVLFAACATFSVCTKDQAYGLYLLAPPAIIYLRWRTNRQEARSWPFWRAVIDFRLWAGAITAAVLFAVCQNLWFNYAGFVDHVRFLVGPGSRGFRVFASTPAGHLALLRLTLRLIQLSMGWPLFSIGAAGVLIAAATPEVRRAAVWVALPAVSYYFGFIDVILYNYDRFVLPICFILAIFGGLAIDALLKWGRSVPLTRVAIAAVFAYSLLYGSTVDVLMIRDSRYTVQGWMKAHVRSDDVVAFSGVHEILPTLDEFKRTEIGTVDELKRERPAYVVINADYAHAVAPESGWGQMLGGLQHGTLGYRLALRVRQPSPWPWLPGAHPDLVGPREQALVFSTLQFVNPTIEVFQREAGSTVDPTPQ